MCTTYISVLNVDCFLNYVYIRNPFPELLLPLISRGFELVLRTVLYSDLRVVDQKYGLFRVDKSYEISRIGKGLNLQMLCLRL